MSRGKTVEVMNINKNNTSFSQTPKESFSTSKYAQRIIQYFQMDDVKEWKRMKWAAEHNMYIEKIDMSLKRIPFNL